MSASRYLLTYVIASSPQSAKQSRVSLIASSLSCGFAPRKDGLNWELFVVCVELLLPFWTFFECVVFFLKKSFWKSIEENKE